jgi:DNA-binding MarR family transcriptional regulator
MSQISKDLLDMRDNNIGRLFQHAGRNYSERALALLHIRGFSDITLFHTVLISNLDTRGAQISAIAEKAGITKQAMGQLVNDLEKKGYVKKTKSADDSRAYMINFTERGKEALLAAYEVKVIIENEYKELLGIDNLESLREILKTLINGNH